MWIQNLLNIPFLQLLAHLPMHAMARVSAWSRGQLAWGGPLITHTDRTDVEVVPSSRETRVAR